MVRGFPLTCEEYVGASVSIQFVHSIVSDKAKMKYMNFAYPRYNK